MPPAQAKRIDPLVSVIIATIGRSNGLPRAVRSVINQSWQNFEVIVVDNGPNSCKMLLSEWAVDPRVRYMQIPAGSGACRACNHGVREARGDFIVFLDDDDYFLPDHLETLTREVTGGCAKIAYTDAVRVHELWDHVKSAEVGRDVPFSQDFDRRKMLISNYIPVLCVIQPRQVFLAVGGFDESLRAHQDWDLWLRLASRHNFVHVPRITCAFSRRADDDQTTLDKEADFYATMVKIYTSQRDVSTTFPGVIEEQNAHLAGFGSGLCQKIAAALPQDQVLGESDQAGWSALEKLCGPANLQADSDRRQTLLAALVCLLKSLAQANSEMVRERKEKLAAQHATKLMKSSWSWRLTTPLRLAQHMVNWIAKRST